MATFLYEVQDKTGKTVRGAMNAHSPQEVEAQLAQRGFSNVQVKTEIAGSRTSVMPQSAVTVTGSQLYNRNAASLAIPSPKDMALFFRQMASLMHAGFSVSTALSDLGMRTAQRGIADAAKQMGAATAGGASVAQEMAKYPTIFAPHVVGLVAAGETGGFLEFSFEEAALNAEQDAALREGLWLPKFLFWQSIWSVLFFAPLFPSIDVINPAKSVGNYFRIFLFLCVPLGILMHVAAEAIGRMRHQPFARDFFDRISLRIPVMARLAHVRALAAFTRVLRRLLMSGISAPVAYAAAVEAVPNAALRERLGMGLPLVQSGQGIDAAINATGLLGNDPLQLLITGQKTGQFVEMLDRVTTYYQEEAQRATDAAKGAEKKLAGIITLISMGYVLIAATHDGYALMFNFVDKFDK
jgi:type II secretory pathway component PulF